MSKRQPTLTEHKLARRHGRFGWTWLLLWLLLGFTLEMLHGFKISEYLLDSIRREFWTLAHFHGVTLALVNLIYVRWAESEQLPVNQRNLASWSLIAGTVLMPVGFFLGGLIHFEGDPGLGIFLAPPGALLILFTVLLQTIAAWRGGEK
jgi:hypothetical protein